MTKELANEEFGRVSSELSNLRINTRNLLGALKKLEKCPNKGDRMYWTKAMRTWRDTINASLQPAPQLVNNRIQELIDEYKKLLVMTKGAVPSLVVEDLFLRFECLIETFLATENLRQVISVDHPVTFDKEAMLEFATWCVHYNAFRTSPDDPTEQDFREWVKSRINKT